MHTKISIYVDHVDDSAEFDMVTEWLLKWEGKVRVVSYSTGGWEHCWDIVVPEEAVAEIPKRWLCESDWSST